MAHGSRIRLCMRDLYHQDVVEMIERETRKYEIWTIDTPEDADFPRAFKLLWDAFGPSDEMEPEAAIRSFLLDNPFEPGPGGTFMKYFMIAAWGSDGELRGVRDGTILVNPAYSPDLCAVYLAHIFMLPDARGTVLSYWLRIAAVEIAVQYLLDLHQRGLVKLPQPDRPGAWFGMRLNMTAEMEFWAPEDPISLQRILFYGRGGFDAINPRHFPYSQPDFRPVAEIQKDGVRPVPFMILLRRMGREREAWVPIDEAAATMRLLYDDFASFCVPENLRASLDKVTARLDARRAAGKDRLELLPLPTGPRDIQRLKRLWRPNVYARHYADNPVAQDYLAQRGREELRRPASWLNQQFAEIGEKLNTRSPWVYGNRDKEFTFMGTPLPPQWEPPPEPELQLGGAGPGGGAAGAAEEATSLGVPAPGAKGSGPR